MTTDVEDALDRAISLIMDRRSLLELQAQKNDTMDADYAELSAMDGYIRDLRRIRSGMKYLQKGSE